MDGPHRDDPDATGFDFTRRTVLKAGTALGFTSAIAGCTDEEEPTPTPPLDPMTNFVDDGLEIVDSGFVDSDSVWKDLRDSTDGSATDSTPSLGGDLARNYLQVLVKNTLQTPISVVDVSVEVFDGDLEFLGVQSAMISSLLSQEVFEGYLPYFYEDAAAYVLRATRSRRPDGEQQLDSVNVGHCMVNEQVRGTVTNNKPMGEDRLRVLVRFYDGDGHVLGTGTDTITGLGGQRGAEFEVDVNAVVEHSATRVEDYSVTVGDYDGELLAVR